MTSPNHTYKSSLQSVLEEIAVLSRWLDDEALPIWSKTAFDTELGLFHERLDPQGKPCKELPRRLLVQCRQLSVYAYATLRGRLDAKSKLKEAFERIRSLYAVSGHRGQWRFSVTPEGLPHEDSLDSYTLAFLIFALAWLYRLEPSSTYLEQADDVFVLFDGVLAASGGGVIPKWPAKNETLLQNPNMHLFEACLALYEAASRPQDLARAQRLLDLFEHKMFDRKSRALPERHGEGWTVWSRSENWFEPGHHFEWVWLMRQFERLGGRRADYFIEELLETAVATGLDQNSVVVERIGLERNFRLSSSRNWATCEYIKCCSYEYQESIWQRDLNTAEKWALRALNGLRALRNVFLAHPSRGLWHDRVDMAYKSLTDNAPASSFYHIGFAIAEAERIFTRFVPERIAFSKEKRKALFLDRDGVINLDVNYAHRPDQITLLPGIVELVETANQLGYFVIVVTNQSGVARGYYPESDIITLHHWMSLMFRRSGVAISAFYHCPYLGGSVSPMYSSQNHFDRKPNAGMLKRAALEWNIDLRKSLMIGDSYCDQAAANEVGMHSVLIEGNHHEALVYLKKLAKEDLAEG